MQERKLGADLGKVLRARKQDVDVASVKIQESWDQIGELESYKIDLEQVVKCTRKEYEDAQALEEKLQVSRICSCSETHNFFQCYLGF